MLALNVIHRAPSQLLEPLDLNQGAPLGFLLLSKLTVSLFGHGEFALRLPALLAGMIGLAIFVPLAYRMLDVIAARIAVCLYALAPYLIAYSAEFKQYELDATIAVGLLLLGQARRWFALAIAGMIAVWFSHPAVFVLGGVGLSLLLQQLPTRKLSQTVVRNRRVVAQLRNLLRLLPPQARFELLSSWIIGMAHSCRCLRHPLGDLAWVVHHFLMFFEKPGGMNPTAFGAGGLAAACWLVGVIRMSTTQASIACRISRPVPASDARIGIAQVSVQWPITCSSRCPARYILIAYGAAFILQQLESARRGAGLAVLLLLFLAPVGECYWNIQNPPHREDVREAVANAASRMEAWRSALRFLPCCSDVCVLF